MESTEAEVLQKIESVLEMVADLTALSLPYVPARLASLILGSKDKTNRCIKELADKGKVGVVPLDDTTEKRKGRRHLLYNKEDILRYLKSKELKAFDTKDIENRMRKNK